MKTVVIIGGGASGFFAAIHHKENHPKDEVVILEQSPEVLQKVKISGGGRCNVTHACFDSRELMGFYPRGGKALLGMFSRFQPGDTFDWFEKRGVSLKVEEDGRVFPVTDDSQTIIDCLLGEAKRLGVSILTKRKVKKVAKVGHDFHVHLEAKDPITCQKLVLATGGNRFGHKLAEQFGHQLVEALPSLFTFTINDTELRDLAGLSLANIEVSAPKHNLQNQFGPLLVTHWGLSGPAIIKLSAWGARAFAKINYNFDIAINTVPDLSSELIRQKLDKAKVNLAKKKVSAQSIIDVIPNRFWTYLCKQAGFEHKTWNTITEPDTVRLKTILQNLTLNVSGKSTFKEEFVTSGGVNLDEIETKTMESKKVPGLYVVGELLNIDGVTGGFNFQNAWTTGFLSSV